MSVAAVQARIAEISSRFGVPSVPVSVSTQVAPAPSPTFDEQMDVAQATTWASTGTAAPTVPGATSSLSAQRSSGATAPDAAGERAVALAKQHLGTPYVWGGEAPGGFDCSGLMQWAYKQVGVDLPRVSTQQAKAGREVSAAEARPGDLVFFERGTVDHIGMYAGAGQWVVAPKSGDVVKLQDVDLSKATTIRRVTPDPAAVAGPASWAAAAAQAAGATPYAALFAKAGAEHGVSPALLRAVARAESGFDAGARSPAGAQGLMQLMPATAKSLGVDPLQPAQAVDGAARLLKSHLQRFGATELALAAYNAGPAAVAKHGGVPPYAETRSYVAKVMAELRGGAA
jgi:cell wall-associated NlpC family hydrolase